MLINDEAFFDLKFTNKSANIEHIPPFSPVVRGVLDLLKDYSFGIFEQRRDTVGH